MKTVFSILILGFLTHSSAFAGQADRLYSELKVKEQRISLAGKDESSLDIFEKSIGGLLCTRTLPAFRRQGSLGDAKCSLSVKEINSELIYNALNVAPVNSGQVDEEGQPALGVEVLRKNSGSLVCEKRTIQAPPFRANYECYSVLPN